MPQIEVTFDIDANGILTVTARDKATGKQQDIRITASSGLSKEEIERMKREAQEHAAEDKKRREEIELRNQADQLVYQTDKQLQELGEKIPAEHRTRIEQAKERLQDAIQKQPERHSSGDGCADKSLERCQRRTLPNSRCIWSNRWRYRREFIGGWLVEYARRRGRRIHRRGR